MSEWRNGPNVFCAIAALALCSLPIAAQTPDLAIRLATLRTDAKLPAVAGATFSSSSISPVTAIGVRRMRDETPVAAGDLWHIGSITKSFTSTLGELLTPARAGMEIVLRRPGL